MLQYNYLGSFIDFVLIAPLVNKHGSRLSILEHRRVHGESGGQGQEWLLKGAAPHSAALRSHGLACLPGPGGGRGTSNMQTKRNNVSMQSCQSLNMHI